MSNELKVAMRHSLKTLLEKGICSHREIARLLGLDRKTVDRYARLWAENGPQVPLGLEAQNGPEVPPGTGGQNGPQVPPGILGSRSRCRSYHDLIERKVSVELTARRIYQDLVFDHGFTGAYDSVKRYVRHLRGGTELPCRRMEVEPGWEAQLDFGRGGILEENGRRRTLWCFRIVLSNSRAAYSECVLRQGTDELLSVLEHAFAYFGGVPKTLVPDNLKAAVLHADWFDPELNPKLVSFCEHYGTVVLPTRPYKPEHKGKVESSIKYVKGALRGRVFKGMTEVNAYLGWWEEHVADTRIHGTTKQQVKQAFAEERGHLMALPRDRFANFQEGRRVVQRDGHVEVAKSYYSVPYEYYRRQVWVRWDANLVRVFNDRFEQIALHARKEPGRFSTCDEHIPERKRSSLEKGDDYLVGKAARLGVGCEAWAKALLKRRGIRGLRVLQGLLSLKRRYEAEAIDSACATALEHGLFRLKDLRTLIGRGQVQAQFEFMEVHPLIRNLDYYGNLINHEEA
jgi:transposase